MWEGRPGHKFWREEPWIPRKEKRGRLESESQVLGTTVVVSDNVTSS